MMRSTDTTSLGWRHKGLIGGAALVCAAVGIGLAFCLPPTFQSTAQILLVKKRPEAVGAFEARESTPDEYLTPAPEILKSPLILDKAVRLRDLRALPMFAQENRPLAEVVSQGLAVTPVKPPVGAPTVFKLTFSGKGQEDCAVVLAAVLDSFKDFIDKKYQSVSADTVELLLREKETLRKELAEKEAAYRAFRAKSPFVGKSADGVLARQERLSSIQAKASALMLRRLEAEVQITAIEAVQREGRSREAVLALLTRFPGAGEHERSADKQAALQERLLPLLLEEKKLLETLGPKHPDVEGVRRRIEAARRMVLFPTASFPGSEDDHRAADAALAPVAAKPGTAGAGDPLAAHLELLRQECGYLKASEEALAKALRVEQEEARRVVALDLEDEALRTSVAFTKQLHETLVKRLGEASLLRNAGGYEVEAIEPPTPARKIGPSLRLFAVLGAFVGALLGLVLAYLKEQRRRDPESPTIVATAKVTTTAPTESALVLQPSTVATP